MLGSHSSGWQTVPSGRERPKPPFWGRSLSPGRSPRQPPRLSATLSPRRTFMARPPIASMSPSGSLAGRSTVLRHDQEQTDMTESLQIDLVVNGERCSAAAEPRRTLADFLRDEL